MSNQHLPDIDALLDHIYQHDNSDLCNESRPQRTINIYIEVDEEVIDLPPTIESTLDEQLAPTVTDKAEMPVHVEQPPQNYATETSSTKHQRGTNHAMLLFLIISIVGVLAGITYALLLPMWTPSATISIVTASRQLTTTSTLQLVTNGTAVPMKNQVAGRELPTITMSQQKTILTTGVVRQAAQAAHGFVTFYNAAPYAQTIEVGTLLTGADGIQVITDQTAPIPAAILPTEGQATVSAHAALTGPQGNIKGGDLYRQCCHLNVFVSNRTFHGGQEARTYQTLTQQDITSVVTTIKSSLDRSVQAALQTQVHASETLVTPLSCTSKITPNHQPGEEAVQVQVTMSETCLGITYTTLAFVTIAIDRATQDANTRLGIGYTTTGVQSRIVKTTLSNHGTLDLQVQTSSIWVYPFSQEQQGGIKAMIAGMSKDKATATLLHLTRVQSVSITTKNGTTIPNDIQHIHLIFLQM